MFRKNELSHKLNIERGLHKVDRKKTVLLIMILILCLRLNSQLSI